MIKNIILLLFTIFISFNNNLKAQNIYKLNDYTDSLSSLFDELFTFDGTRYTKSDSDKIKINKKILNYFPQVLNTDSSFFFDFKIKHFGSIYSNDNLLRIITWNIKLSNGEYIYYGYLIHKKNKKNKPEIFPLIDKSPEIINPEKQTLNNLQWFGCLYYKIITTKYAGTKYYTLLGWDGNNYLTTKKIIDILYFSRSGRPKFGKNIFVSTTARKHQKQKRVIFEFSSQTVMSLIYDNRYKAIVFDHLSPTQSNYKGNYEFYGPDFTYDSYKFEKGKWFLNQDIKVKNPKKKK